MLPRIKKKAGLIMELKGSIRYYHEFTEYKKLWIAYFYDVGGVLSAFHYWISTGKFKKCRAFYNHKLIARQATYKGV